MVMTESQLKPSNPHEILENDASRALLVDSHDIEKTISLGPVYKNVVLDKTVFSSRILVGARFEGCSLRDCDFSRADLSYARFIDCDLYRSNLTGAMLYACWFSNCDLTKAEFSNSYMSGFRLSNVDITHTSFGNSVQLGKNRKSVAISDRNETTPLLPFGSKIETISQFEESTSGIGVEGFHLWVELTVDPQGEEWRQWRRRSEVCKILKRVHLENGYFEEATNYYYLERLYKRFAMPWGWRRFADWFFGDLLWGYGVGWHKAVMVLLVSILFFSCIYLALPALGSGNGLMLPSGEVAKISHSLGLKKSSANAGYTLLFSILTASLTGFQDIIPIGWGKLIVTIQVVFGILMISLLVASFAKRIANI